MTNNGPGPRRRHHDLAGGGHGLVGMQERVRVFGGELFTGRRRGGGFEVRARIPVHDQHHGPELDAPAEVNRWFAS